LGGRFAISKGDLMSNPSCIIFWGAGATAALGIRTTKAQSLFIKTLAGSPPAGSLEDRVANALGANNTTKWHAALSDLLTILGDLEENYAGIEFTNETQVDAMRRNWRDNAGTEELIRRIVDLRLTYDWPALKSLVAICPGSSSGTFELNDLFNLLDLHIPLGFGVRAFSQHTHLPDQMPGRQFLDARRLTGAKNALRMLLIAAFYIDWQECIGASRSKLEQYHKFADALWHRQQKRAVEFANEGVTEPAFYQGDVGFVSLNYDPIALWVQFIANRENNSADVPYHAFQDFAHLIPARRIHSGKSNWPWYPMNEGAAQRLNEIDGSKKILLTKFLFPHGCLCWRECPDCRKLSAFHGDMWRLDARGLFPPPPLRAFDTEILSDRIGGDERSERVNGAVDARACLHCGTLTYAQHTQTVMQSSFKSSPPSFVEEIQRDLRATTMRAKHLIFFGYSLPKDDVEYRALFAASCQRGHGKNEEPVRCTVVGKDSQNAGWYHLAAADSDELLQNPTVEAAVKLFGRPNVRFYGGGVPDVFVTGDNVSESKIEHLLRWSSVAPE
jgi:hypothetical protein